MYIMTVCTKDETTMSFFLFKFHCMTSLGELMKQYGNTHFPKLEMTITVVEVYQIDNKRIRDFPGNYTPFI